MSIALWIIAICEVVRAVQNAVQIWTIRKESGMRKNAYGEFVESLKMSGREYVKRLLEEFEESEESE